MFKVLVVEDSPEYQLMLKKILGHHDVTVIDDPDAVERIMLERKIDLVLLDISLPKRDGFSVLAELQSHPELSTVPVVCLTGKSKISDKVTAFSLGADDYVQKPFDPIELKVRIDSKLLKTKRQRTVAEKINCGPLKIDTLSHLVVDSVSGREITLTQTEYKILGHFARHQGQVYSREQLLNIVWGNESAVFDRAVDVHICSLRKKLSAHGVSFKSVPGVGYKLELFEQKKLAS